MGARPGWVKSTYPVELPHPREVKVRTTTAFTQLVQAIWEDLEEEVNKARETGG